MMKDLELLKNGPKYKWAVFVFRKYSLFLCFALLLLCSLSYFLLDRSTSFATSVTLDLRFNDYEVGDHIFFRGRYHELSHENLYLANQMSWNVSSKNFVRLIMSQSFLHKLLFSDVPVDEGCSLLVNLILENELEMKPLPADYNHEMIKDLTREKYEELEDILSFVRESVFKIKVDDIHGLIDIAAYSKRLTLSLLYRDVFLEAIKFYFKEEIDKKIERYRTALEQRTSLNIQLDQLEIKMAKTVDRNRGIFSEKRNLDWSILDREHNKLQREVRQNGSDLKLLGQLAENAEGKFAVVNSTAWPTELSSSWKMDWLLYVTIGMLMTMIVIFAREYFIAILI